MKQRTFKKIIFDDLKKRDLHHIIYAIKSVRYETFSMGNALRVQTLNLFKSDRAILESILKGYEYGRFDAMTDYSYSEKDPTKERQAKYVTLTNEFSDVIKQAAKHHLEQDLGVTDDKSAQDKLGIWYDTAIWRTLQNLESFDQAIAWCTPKPSPGPVEVDTETAYGSTFRLSNPVKVY
jgi:hypothetical protein